MDIHVPSDFRHFACKQIQSTDLYAENIVLYG